ncbi:MAG: DUF1802 family protein [Dehalococcoidia bacterium]|jgi:hypothetical protein|nr:DUF1802 family protein [Dehalococcoidia bacterium]
MSPEQHLIALKEWAVTVQALAQGRQILLLRKGGIREPGKDFRVDHTEFLLYPTYEHQREDLLKDGYQSALLGLLEEPRPEGQITFSHWAKVEEVIELSQQEKVYDLSPHHIWTNAYAQSRLHWKPKLPLALMLLRVYQLEKPVDVPALPEYRGCTSWIEILDRVPMGSLRPVLSDHDFRRQVDDIKNCLGLALSSA